MNPIKKLAQRSAIGLALAVTIVISVRAFVPPAQAEIAYGSHIVAPVREDTAQHPDMNLGPAVRDLQSSLKQMTGTDFTDVRGDENYKGEGIFLVRTSSSKAPADAVTQLKGKGIEPFIIRSKDNKNLWIIANGEEGLAHGVYFYLDKLGCRWFLPNANWNIIPKRTDIAVKIDRLVAPAFQSRTLFGTGGYGPTFALDPKVDKEYRLQFAIREDDWTRRNGFGGQYILGGHMGESFNLDEKAILEKHPEYYAPIDGKRAWSEEGKLDPTNTDAVKLWVDYCLGRFREQYKADPNSPYSWAVSVDPSDGGGYCTTDACKAEFQAHGENDETFYSNQVFYMANEVAKAVRKEFPDGFVSLYAYADHSAPPSFALEPNVAVMMIPYGFNYSGLSANDLIAAWSKKTTHLSIYDYWSIPDWTWDQPSFNYLQTPKDKIGYWYAHKVTGFHGESTYSAGAMGIAWYLSSRLMWNPHADQDWFLADFYNKSFGPAAPPMKRMMERWATSFMLTSQEMAMSFRDLREAEKLAAGDTAIQSRIDDFAKYVQYLRLYKEYSYVSDPKLRQEADKKLIEHIFDIYDTNMVGSFRIYQFLVDYGRNKELYDEFDNTKPDAPGWKLTKPYTHDEVSDIIADGVKDYQLLDFTPINYNGKLVALTPVHPLSVPDGDAKWGTRMETKGGMDLQVDVPVGLDAIPFRVDQYYDKTITLIDSSGKAVWHTDVKGLKNSEQDTKFNIPLPGAGRYTIQIRAAAFYFQTLKGLEMVFPNFIAEMGAPSPRVYFYVPSGLRTIAMYIPAGDFGGSAPQIWFDPNGKQVPVKSYDGGTLVIAIVPEEQDGKAWSMVSVRTPNAPFRMLNVPNFFSLSPDTLMVPQDALK
ncbi:MAG: DUF4838 domain-containing protein [Abditibacteriaceae bacterium]